MIEIYFYRSGCVLLDTGKFFLAQCHVLRYLVDLPVSCKNVDVDSSGADFFCNLFVLFVFLLQTISIAPGQLETRESK